MMFIGHADAAMQLDVRVGIGDRGLIGEMLGSVEMDCSIRPRFLDRSGGVPQLAPGCLCAQCHVRAWMTHGLIGPDLASESLADLRIFDDQFQRDFGEADLYCSGSKLAELPHG